MQGGRLGDTEQSYHALIKEYEYAKEREAVLMGDRLVVYNNSSQNSIIRSLKTDNSSI